MRILMKVTMPVDEANAAVKDGTLGKKLQAIAKELKPEAVYFLAENGCRTGYFFLDLHDPSEIPAVAEPFFLAFNAKVEMTPVMVPSDLAKASGAMAEAVRNHG